MTERAATPPWPPGWRDAFWAQESSDSGGEPWDVVVIGGGISGAGVLREAARAGLRAVLLEQQDFAAGTSSRSSKLVHGGLRYLATGDWKLTREAVRERQRLLAEAPGLVNPQRMLVPIYAGGKPRNWEMRIGLRLYDAFAGRRLSYALSPQATAAQAPGLDASGLRQAWSFQDADTDDTRLVLRVLRDARAEGGAALNYARVVGLEQHTDGLQRIDVEDAIQQTRHRLRARVVINASGAWAAQVAQSEQYRGRLRPLRGSHLLVPLWRMPLGPGVSWQHHEDRRNVFVYPWAGVALIGTTDLDHEEDLQQEPRATPAEMRYLLDAVNRRFPRLRLRAADVISTYAGVRPVVSSGAADPSAESRESALWVEPGRVTLCGGKLTTFRVAAQQALEAARPWLPGLGRLDANAPIFRPASGSAPPARGLRDDAARQRLQGLYGAAWSRLLAQADPAELRPIGSSPHLWAELRWACAEEAVETLGDLLLRRTRLGLLLPDGAAGVAESIRRIAQPALGWDDARWAREYARYREHWQQYHAPPTAEVI